MKTLLLILMLPVMLIGCGGDTGETPKADAALKAQADIAKATLQEKADALARSAPVPPK